MQIAVDWKNSLGFTALGPSRIPVELSGNADNPGLSPMELMAFALAGCTGMDVISILQKKRQPVEAFQVRVNTERREDYPRVWTHVLVEYQVTGEGVDADAVQRAIDLSTQKYCPAYNMLKHAVQIDSTFTIHPA